MLEKKARHGDQKQETKERPARVALCDIRGTPLYIRRARLREAREDAKLHIMEDGQYFQWTLHAKRWSQQLSCRQLGNTSFETVTNNDVCAAAVAHETTLRSPVVRCRVWQLRQLVRSVP